MSDEPSGESVQDSSPDLDMPTAARFPVPVSNDLQIKERELDVNWKILEIGDELVRRKDAEEAMACITHSEYVARYCEQCLEEEIGEARRSERRELAELIQDKIDEIEERFHNGDKASAGILDKSDLVSEVLETVEDDLLDEVEQ